jgi:tetratricopeptide (TPR) repeat protein
MNDWDDAERRVERAQELFEQRRWSEALEELRAATDINPYNAGWHFNIGLTLDEMGRFPRRSTPTAGPWRSTPTTCTR